MTDILRRLHCTIRCDIETAESGCHCAEGRDTITALRANVERLEADLATARADALEEAARVVTEHYQELSAEHRLLLLNRAAAIRALIPHD